MQNSYSSSSYYYSSSTNSGDGSNTSGHRYTTTSHRDPEGHTIVRTARQDLGEPTVVEERRYDSTGKEQPMIDQPGGGATQRITELGEAGEPTGSSPGDPPISYGGPEHGAAEGEGQGTRSFGYDESTDRVTNAGAFNEAVDYNIVYGRPGRGIARPGYAATSGYTDFDRKMREFEDPSTGARIRRESDIDISTIFDL